MDNASPAGAPPLFTIILTTYNRAQLLPRAIRSVLAQTCGDYETLIMDNGSTDSTPEVIRQYTDPRLIYIRNPQPTSSCDVPRNMGIARARGRYTAFLDDDDTWYPEKLQRVNEVFEQHPEVAAVCHHEHCRNGDRIESVLRHGPWSEDLFERLLYERNCLSSCATTLKTEVLRELNGFTIHPDMDAVADLDLWLRMSRAGHKVHFLEEPLGAFYVTGQNLSLVDPKSTMRLVFIITHHLLQYEGRPLHRISRRGMWRLMQMYFYAFRHCARYRDVGNAARYAYHTARCLVLKPALLANIITFGGQRLRVRLGYGT